MLVANPNLCLDRTVRLRDLRVGAVHRSDAAEVTAGGKGVNVARVLRAHGHRPVVAGLVPREDGQLLESLLADEGAELVGVPVPGSTRVATILLEDDGRVTVVNEPGPELDADTWRAYLTEVTERLHEGEVLVCTGSLPPGAPDDAYGQLTRTAASRGAVVVVDAARQALAGCLAAHPDVVTPNLAEAEAVLADRHGGAELVDDAAADVLDRARAAAHSLVAAGARRAVVTVGAAGAAFASPEADVVVQAPPVRLVSPVGAGDSLVGGLVLGLGRGEDWLDCVRRGVATASASCEQLRAGGVDPARAEELLRGTRALPSSDARGRA